MDQFTENDFKILKAILDRGDNKKGLSIVTGTTVEEIVVKTNLSSKKIRDTLNKFKEIGYVDEGIKKVRTKTYIMTKEGLLFLKSIRMNIFGEEFKNE